MRILFFLSLFLTAATGLAAQFGVTGFYQQSFDDFRTEDHPDGGALGSGFEVAADYWFRLQNKRVEFLPTVSYGQYTGEARILPGDLVDMPRDFTLRTLGVQFKTNFYLFDFGTDCDCPTFGKQGPALHKGFFVQLAPGITYLTGEFGETQLLSSGKEKGQFLFTTDLGVGVDFGLSNLITLTPMLSYRHYWREAELATFYPAGPVIDPSGPPPTARMGSLQAGLRLGIRLDKRRY